MTETSNNEKTPDEGTETPQGQNKMRKRGLFKKTTNKPNKFKGRCEGLENHMYDRTGTKQQQAEAFTKTTEEIANYVGREYTQGYYVRVSIEDMNLYDINTDQPEDIADDATKTETEIWKEEIKGFEKTKTTFTSNLRRLYSLIWGQCSKTMRAELESMTGFNNIARRAEPLELLKLIRSVAHNFNSEKHPIESLHITMRSFYTLHQGQDSTQTY